MSRGPVIVGLDGSEQCWRALEIAVRLSTALGVELVAAHGPHHPAITEFSAAALAAEHEVEASIEATIRSRLEEVAPTAQLRILGEGRAGEALSDLADALDAEMIVVATRGRGLVRSAALGSVAHHLVTHANAPVLVVR